MGQGQRRRHQRRDRDESAESERAGAGAAPAVSNRALGRLAAERPGDPAVREAARTGTLTGVRPSGDPGSPEVVETEERSRTLDTSGWTSRRSRTRETTGHHVRASHTTEATTQASGTGIGRTDTTSATVTDTTDDSSTTVSEQRRRTFAADAGRASYGRSSEVTVTETAADGSETARTRTRSGGGGLVHGAEGSGATAQGSIGASRRRGTVTVGSTLSADGAFTVDVDQISDHPRKFRITVRVHVGLGGGVSADRGGETTRVSGGVSASGQAQADLVFTRELDERVAAEYLGDLDALAEGATVGGRPEYGMVARVRAARAADGLGSVGAVLGSADAVRSMVPGESMQLDLRAGGDVGASLGSTARSGLRPGAAASVSAGVSGGRRVTVTRTASGVEVAVRVTAEQRLSGSVTGSLGASSVGYAGSSTDSDTVQVVFRLDPSATGFGERLDEITELHTEAQARTYGEQHPDLVASTTDETSEQSSQSATLGVGPLGLRAGTASRRSSSVTRGTDADGRQTLVGTESGGQTASGDLQVAGVNVLRGSQENAVTARVGPDGELTVDLDQVDRETDVVRSAEEAARVFGGRSGFENVLDIITSGPGGVLKRYAERTVETLTRYELSAADVDALVRRAGNESGWDRAVVDLDVEDAWDNLRVQLVDPRPTAELREADPSADDHIAKELARGAALADFMSEYGDEGHDGLVRVLRYWGAGIGGDLTLSTSEDLAVMWQWPPALAGTRERWDQLRPAVRGLESRLDGLVAGGQIGTGREVTGRLRAGLRRVRREIENCDEFDDPRAKLEMMAEVQRAQRAVQRAASRFERTLAEQASQAPTEEIDPAAIAARPEQVVIVEAPAEELMSHPGDEPQLTSEPPVLMSEPYAIETVREMTPDEFDGLQRQRADLIAELERFRDEQEEQFDNARDMLPTEAGGNVSGIIDTLMDQDVSEAISTLGDVAELHEQWIARIRQLRTIYRALTVPEGEWVVKPGPDDERRRLDPDIDALCDMYEGVNQWMAGTWLLFPVMGYREIAQQWRARADY